MNYEAQVLRGEKWFHLMTPAELAAEPQGSSKNEDVKIYLESCEKVKAEKKPKKQEEGKKDE